MLTGRDKQLLRRLASGQSDHEIAQQIGGTDKQIDDQRQRLLARLGVGTQEEITEAAKRLARFPYRQNAPIS